MNRLKLDFTLESAQDRSDFINQYIQTLDSVSPSEATTIADYLLWGKDSTGKPVGNELNLETKWSREENVPDSLDAVLEQPGASHIVVKDLNNATIYRKPRVVFDRAQTRKEAPPFLLPTFEELWRTIDELDLEINLYEERTGKRDKPPRDELIKRFTYDEFQRIDARSRQLNQYTYLKKRHQLVDLRREQFTIRDSYKTTFNLAQTIFAPHTSSTVFDCDVPVLPLGLCDEPTGKLIFTLDFDPARFSEEQLQSISKLVWAKKKVDPSNSFDFRNLEAVYQLYLFKTELLDQIERNKLSSKLEPNQESLLQTLNFYEQLADLTDLQIEILRLKEQKTKNQDIADYINKKYGKSYTANYISTIFRQKIIVKINEAAELHRETIENCFFPENFRRCPDCGRVLLLDSRNWVRKARSKDGFQNKCKSCEKKGRSSKNK